jgi:hypothetical protein
MGFSKSTFCLMIALTLLMAGCANQPLLQEATVTPPAASLTITGQVSFDSSIKTQVTSGDVTKGAAVSLIDAVSGYTYGTTEADSAGNFTLSFYDTTTSSGGGYPISPSTGVPYILEAVKGVTTNSDQNHAGSDMIRMRSLLFWNNGWLSLTNSAPGKAVSINQATTALAIAVGYKQQTGSSIELSSLVGSLEGSIFYENGTGLSKANDYQAVLIHVKNALIEDQDPVANILFDRVNGQYSRITPIPTISSIHPLEPQRGQMLTVYGSNFERLDAMSVFWFGDIPAATWSISPDRMSLTLPVPRNAVPSPLKLKHAGGLVYVLAPVLNVK